MADNRAAIAHLLRRTGFGPFPGQVEALNPGGLAAALDAVLGAAPPSLPAPPDIDDGDGERPPEWWLRRMRDPAAGLHEKMTWFWHGHLTSAYDKVGSWRMMWNQHGLVRQHALGNYRTMLTAMTVDAAMLIYLDGDPSEAVDPNENYARELQERFTIGVENVLEENLARRATRDGESRPRGSHHDVRGAVRHLQRIALQRCGFELAAVDPAVPRLALQRAARHCRAFDPGQHRDPRDLCADGWQLRFSREPPFEPRRHHE